MQKSLPILLAFLIPLALAVGPALAGETATCGAPAPAAEPTLSAITLDGQFVDATCYLVQGATSGEHQECAVGCITAGGPVGFKTKDGFYLVLVGNPMSGADAMKAAQAQYAGWANQPVTVKGMTVARDGVSVLMVDMVTGADGTLLYNDLPEQPGKSE